MCVRDEKEYIVFVSCIVCGVYVCVCALCGMHNPPSRGIGLLEFALPLLPFVPIGINVYCFSSAVLCIRQGCLPQWIFMFIGGVMCLSWHRVHTTTTTFASVVSVVDLQTIGKMLPLPFFVLSPLLPVPHWACICLCGAFHSFVAVNAWNCPRTTRIQRNSWHNA